VKIRISLCPIKYLLLLTAVFSLALLTSRPAAAHAVPISSSPLPSQIMDEGPDELIIYFNEPVVPEFGRIRLLTQAGQPLDVGPAQPEDDNRTLRVGLPTLSEGAYLVSWQVLSAVDGHTTSGTFSFGVGDVILEADEADSVLADISAFSASARWLTLTGLALLIGFFSFRLLVWRPLFAGVEMEPEEAALDEKTVRAGLRIVYVALGLLGLALILTMIDQATAYRLWEGGNWRPWFSTQFGQMWLLRLLLLLPFLILLAYVTTQRRRLVLSAAEADAETLIPIWFLSAGLVLSVLLAGTSSMISHSAALSQNTWQAIGVDLTHTLAAGVWAGGLLFLALALFQARSLEPELKTWLNLSLILNFSAVAALSVGLLIFSGAYLAGQHVGNWTALVGTAYGLVLLGKLAVALVAFALAAFNLLVIKPRLNAAYDMPESPAAAQTRRRFRAVVAVEAVLALVILAAAGLLSDMQRGVDAPLLADAPGQMTTSAAADDLTVELALEPALVGQNRFEVTLLDEQGNPVADAQEVLFRFTFLGQSLGSEEATAESLGDGRYLLEGSYISLIGSWQVEVSVRRPGQFDAFAPYRLEAGLGGEIRPLTQRTPILQTIAHWMTLAAGGGTGLLLMLVRSSGPGQRRGRLKLPGSWPPCCCWPFLPLAWGPTRWSTSLPTSTPRPLFSIIPFCPMPNRCPLVNFTISSTAPFVMGKGGGMVRPVWPSARARPILVMATSTSILMATSTTGFKTALRRRLCLPLATSLAARTPGIWSTICAALAPRPRTSTLVSRWDNDGVETTKVSQTFVVLLYL
jgi:copper transport protein